jgi:hypothetical protein
VTLNNRTVVWLRNHGLMAASVESKIFIRDPATKRVMPITRDLFGWADVLYVNPYLAGIGTFGLIQVTDNSNLSTRIKKMQSLDLATAFMHSQHAWAFGWRKSAGRWVPKIVKVSPDKTKEWSDTEFLALAGIAKGEAQ